MNSHVLEIKNLTVHYACSDGLVKAVNDISLSIDKAETLGLVGETGAGKTTTALSVIKLIQSPPGKIVSGEILFNGKNIFEMSDLELRRLRGKDISMIFQDPMTALNPIVKVEDQIAEAIYMHEDISKQESLAKARRTLELVDIPASRGCEYPHQFSGGMQQRVVIAMALACSPQLLIADEPTTALDVTIQAQVLDMMRDLKKKLGSSMLLITHDLGVVAETCDAVAIMYAGEIVEYGTIGQIFDNTLHPYTEGLFGSLPNLDEDVRRLKPIAGMMPDPSDLPEGCKFHPRCPCAMPECRSIEPPYTSTEAGHFVRCHKYRIEEKTPEMGG